MHRIFRNIKYKLAGLFLVFKMHGSATAQIADNNFDAEINYYKQADSSAELPAAPVLFIGSSSIKNWIGFDTCFKDIPVLNRGFGGSTLTDQIFYAEDIILKHQPQQIVMYCGENDFAQDSVSASTVFIRFYDLYQLIRNKFPEVPIVFISIKPSPSKINMLSSIREFNLLVGEFITHEQNIVYADVYSKMLNSDGKPDASLFYDDMLHMNEKGYHVWNEVVRPLIISR
ncbi:MAG: GDSL-type esterase/lipase family protein [Chitinophagales bacterium]